MCCGNYSCKEKSVEPIEKVDSNQDIQHFLGTYHLKGICEDMVQVGFVFPDERDVIISEGIESDLLINIDASANFNNFKVYFLKDSLYIPLQWWNNFDETQASFQGKGKIENDSLFLRYGVGGTFGVIECHCKGEKISAGISSPDSDIDLHIEQKGNSLLISSQTRTILSNEIVSVSGNKIIQSKNNFAIDISTIPTGIYFIYTTFTDNTTNIVKWLKK